MVAYSINWNLELSWSVLPKAPYSPGRASTDYKLWRSLQDILIVKIQIKISSWNLSHQKLRNCMQNVSNSCLISHNKSLQIMIYNWSIKCNGLVMVRFYYTNGFADGKWYRNSIPFGWKLYLVDILNLCRLLWKTTWKASQIYIPTKNNFLKKRKRTWLQLKGNKKKIKRGKRLKTSKVWV